MQVTRHLSPQTDTKLSGKMKSNTGKGKENCITSPPCLLYGEEKQTLPRNDSKAPQKSKLPVLSKTKPPPDFQKMHEAWQNRFQKGKAVSKKSCTHPCPFNLSKKGDQSRVASLDYEGCPMESPSKAKSQCTTGLTAREPLSEVVHGQNITAQPNEIPIVEFKADPAALTSILSNAGIAITDRSKIGKLSLAQRVPMKVSSTVSSCKNTMFRNSMYTAPCSQLPRFSWLPWKGSDQNILLKQKQENKTENCCSTLKKHTSSKEDCVIPSQVNPVLQQMKVPSNEHSGINHEFAKKELTVENSVTVKAEFPKTRHELSGNTEQPSVEQEDLLKKKHFTETVLKDFVADSQALANIFSHTGAPPSSTGKLNLAQRIPVQSRHLNISGTPKTACARLPAGNKDGVLNSCRVVRIAQTPAESPLCSARRVHRTQSSVMPVFPKTPRTLALERANKRLEAQHTDLQNTKSRVRWADDPSPTSVSEAACEEPSLEQVAVRLFQECPGDVEDKKSFVSEPVLTLDIKHAKIEVKEESPVPNNVSANNRTSNDVVSLDSQDLSLHLQFAPSCTISCTEPTKTTFPLSFLAHPACQDLQSSTFGSHSLSHIARLRLHATVSAKQKFWDTCLDEECAFYTSRGLPAPFRSCMDPVAITLKMQEDLHFIPIDSGEA
ncbi:hypothetical protein GDO86_004259 [Hymenochirus boettgeri]|uniref:Uncharacterized protein n=1 Tax=Hymenochirus boettgeri TaxID=247094 RepID=A0A8T2K744_9PIPI|nr:hypothetical protein GDO86_004259 [Hymenochirus boettgeri]